MFVAPFLPLPSGLLAHQWVRVICGSLPTSDCNLAMVTQIDLDVGQGCHLFFLFFEKPFLRAQKLDPGQLQDLPEPFPMPVMLHIVVET